MKRPVQITRRSKGEFYETIFGLYEKMPSAPSQIPLSRLSKLLAERRITDAAEPVPDCITCGACCVFGLVIPLGRRDPEPLQAYLEITLDEADDVIIERVLDRDTADGRCTNLTGVVGDNIGCKVYSDRPQICRDFDAGSDRCFGYRRLYGIDPPLSAPELEEAERRLGGRHEKVKIRGIEIKLERSVMRFDRTATETDKQLVEERTLKIVAHMSDGIVMDIHTYDPAKESWYEHELEGSTLEEANAVIAERKVV